MKKQSWRRRNTLIPSGIFLVGSSIVLIGVVVLVLRFFAPGALTFIASPLWRFGGYETDRMHELSAYFLDRRTLADDRDRLTAENNALRSANRALATQVTDVTRLVGGRTEAAHRILAGILARPPVTPYDTLVLDRGEEDGVVVGSIVYAPGNVPLGTIESSTKKTARAALYSAGGRITEGWIGEKRVAISLVGHGAGTFSATLPRESMAQVGDTVYIPGPGALPIGTIVRIDTNPSSPSDTIHISPFTNLFSLTWVEVSQGS